MVLNGGSNGKLRVWDFYSLGSREACGCREQLVVEKHPRSLSLATPFSPLTPSTTNTTTLYLSVSFSLYISLCISLSVFLPLSFCLSLSLSVSISLILTPSFSLRHSSSTTCVQSDFEICTSDFMNT